MNKERGRPPSPGVAAFGSTLSAEYSRCPGRALQASSSQRGIALIAVLWLTVLLTVIASGFAYSMRGEALAARNTMSLAQARAAADGAVERMAFELSRQRTLPDVWFPDGQPRAWNDGDIAITATSIDEAGRIDINLAPDPLLKGLLQNVGGLDPESAEQVLQAILDWRDPDDLRRPNGAEAADYRAAGLKYVPSNGRFESTGELQRVLGVTPGLIAKIADSVTTYSRQRGINTATAPRDVLLALPGITPEQVDAYINDRRGAIANRLPVPPLPAASGLASGPSPVWRIHAEATAPDGVTFARDAVLRPQGDPRQPMVVLLWQEGVSAPRPGSPSATEYAMRNDGTNKP